MRVLFTSVVGHGHIRPLVPYAKALLAQGHDVTVASPEASRSLVEASGLPFVPFGRMTDEELRDFWAGYKGLDARDFPRIGVSKLFADKTARHAIPALEAFILRWQPDVIVRDSVEFGAYVLARKHGIPCVRLDAHNMEAETMIIGLAHPSIDTLLSEHGVAPDEGAGLRAQVNLSIFPAGFDGDAVPEDQKAPIRTRPQSAGQLAEADWAPKGDKPLVYVTFGTVVGGESFDFRDVFVVALDAVRGLDAEVLLTTGPKIDPTEFADVPPNVDIRQFVPQDAVLRHASAVVFHGGSGTLTGALAAGVPMVIVPLFADQPWNADRVEKAGLGLAVRDRTAENLGQAIGAVLGTPSFGDRAAAVAKEVALMPEIDVAIDAILQTGRQT